MEKYIRNDQYGIPVRIFTYKLRFRVGIEHLNNLKNTILQENVQMQSKNANKYHDKLSIIWLLIATADDEVKVNYYQNQ